MQNKQLTSYNYFNINNSINSSLTNINYESSPTFEFNDIIGFYFKQVIALINENQSKNIKSYLDALLIKLFDISSYNNQNSTYRSNNLKIKILKTEDNELLIQNDLFLNGINYKKILIVDSEDDSCSILTIINKETHESKTLYDCGLKGNLDIVLDDDFNIYLN